MSDVDPEVYRRLVNDVLSVVVLESSGRDFVAFDLDLQPRD